jgi:isopentenyl-diphosphate delta-isomerase
VVGVDEELVVLLDEDGHATGTLPKRLTHHADTPLHLGFSCYLLDPRGRLLVTRRAVAKASFGGVWTNTVCGHPGPGEPHAQAVARRARFELGVGVRSVTAALPRFRYRAEQGGVVENEWCPVYLAVTDDEPVREPSEVEEHRWTTWEEFLADSRADPATWSPWCLEQSAQLESAGLVTAFRAQVLAAA